MAMTGNTLAADYAAMDDTMLVRRVRDGDREAFRDIMRRCNQRLFRIARGLTDDDAEAEDVVQTAYVHAYEHLDTFRADAALSTWLTRIVLNEAYGRLRKRRRTVDIEKAEASLMDRAQTDSGQVVPFPTRFGTEDPAAVAARDQARRLLEQAVNGLPELFRVVFILREIEQCSVEETATALDLRPETVKTRLHRARRLLRTALQDTLSATLADTFPFLGARCDRMTTRVMRLLEAAEADQPAQHDPSLHDPDNPRHNGD